MNLKMKMDLMKNKNSKTESKMAEGIIAGTIEKKPSTASTSQSGEGSAKAASSAIASAKVASSAIASAKADSSAIASAKVDSSAIASAKVNKLIKREQKNLALREKIIKAMKEEIVELDAFIKAKFEATGETDPEDAKLRRKLVRHVSEAKRLFFPKPKLLTEAEREEAQVAVQSWNQFREELLNEQAVAN